MRILRIELENLNSLYGKHEVDLAGALGDVPLFLIRGPTGAGKSTLMDAVALALFGVTPRLRRGKGKDEEDPRLVMSRGEGTASARVEIKLGQVGAEQRYRATWYCWRSRRKPDGALQVPRRTLERWDAGAGEWVELASGTKVKEYAEAFDRALEGMTVEDFKRMILLAQGEFAAFLKADEKERGAILERLTSTERYQEIGQRANRRRQKSEKVLTRARADLEGLELMSPEREEEVTRALADARAEEKARRGELTRARGWFDWRRERDKLLVKLEAERKEDGVARREVAEHQEDLARLAEYERCAPAEEPLRTADRLVKDAREQEEKLPALRDRQAALGASQAALTAAVKEAKESVDGARAALEAKAEEINRARKLKDRLASAAGEQARANKEQSAAEQVAGAKEQAAEGLEPTELTPEQIQEQRQELRERGAALRLALGLVAEEQELNGLQHARAEKAAGAEERLARSGDRLVELERAREDGRAAQKALAVRLEEVGWIRGLAKEREQLQEGEPCPLCGSIEHPLMGEGGLDEVEKRWADLQSDRAEQEQAEQRLQQEAALLKEGSAVDTAALEGARKELEAGASRLEALPGELAPHLQVLGMEPGPAVKLAGELKGHEEELGAAQADLDLLARAAVAHLELRLAQEAAAKTAAALAERSEAVDQLGKQIAGVLDGQDPDEVEGALKVAIGAAEKQWERQGEALKKGSAELEKITAALESARGRLAELAEMLEAARAALAEQLVALELDNAEALRPRLLDVKDRKALADLRERLNKRGGQAAARLGQREEEWKNHLAARPGDLEPGAMPGQELEQKVAALDEAVRQLGKRVGALGHELAEQLRRKDKSRELAAEVEAAEQEHALWLRLHKLIGEGEGEAFKKFAQTLNLAELLGKANAHLERLEPRYELVPVKDPATGEPRLAFSVMDMYQAGEHRPLNTLSGGETFLVSLAMALALADYGSSRMPVETLLLDEGFGTLDHETLQMAMNALAGLNARGTQVGIISHVEVLKDHIPACVVVEKLGGGRSRVRVGE